MAKKNKGAEIRQHLIALNEAYRAGQPEVSDVEYDALVEELRSINPNDEFFNKGIVEQADDRMEDLPVPMFSLEKIKEVKKLRKWLQKMCDAGAKEIVAMPKYDGISLVTHDLPLPTQAWTRGDGVQGQRSDKHFAAMNNGKSGKYFCNIHTWGEAICKKLDFAHLKENHGIPYKNARNMVAGMFNSPDGYKNNILPFVDFVRYGCDEPIDKADQLQVLRQRYKNVTISREYFVEELLELDDAELNEWLDIELHEEFDKEYKIDGVVLEVNEYAVREKLGRLPNGNPAYAIAFKREEWCDTYQTKVTGMEFGIGKTGTLNPVILIEPVEIGGATVSRATAYNAAYIVDNHICEGATIEITRSGDVIPKHLKTLEYNTHTLEKMMDDLVVCPSCGEPLKWNESLVDLVCENKKCPERVISETVYFFRTLGCEGFEEPTIRLLHKTGWIGADVILDMSKSELQMVLGTVKGVTVYDAIHTVCENGVPFARYLAALNIFDGKIAEATCQKILDNAHPALISEQVLRSKLTTIDPINPCLAVYIASQLEKINGVGNIIANTFVKGLIKLQRMEVTPEVNFSYVMTPKVEVEAGVEKMVVCMTGFRDKEMEATLKAKGHTVVSGVTKECNVLVVADMNSNSSKMKTAKERGLRVVQREEFMRELLL